MSGVTGLAQLACLTVTGLLGCRTHHALSVAAHRAARRGAIRPIRRCWRGLNARIERLPRPFALLAVIPLAAVAVFLLRPDGFWQNDLSKLTSGAARAAARRRRAAPRDGHARPALPAGGQRRERGRGARGAGDARTGACSARRARAPSAATNMRRGICPAPRCNASVRPRCPGAKLCARCWRRHGADLPFEDDLFEPFVADVARAKTLPPLTRADLSATPLALRVASELFPARRALVRPRQPLRRAQSEGVAEIARRQAGTSLSSISRPHPSSWWPRSARTSSSAWSWPRCCWSW